MDRVIASLNNMKSGSEGGTIVHDRQLICFNTNITSLPDDLIVRGFVDLSDTDIETLPENLNVRGFLDIRYTDITKLPENLKVGGCLYLDHKKITNIVYCENIGCRNLTLIAAWIDGAKKIISGNNIYSSDLAFAESVSSKYESNLARHCIHVARECIEQLERLRYI